MVHEVHMNQTQLKDENKIITYNDNIFSLHAKSNLYKCDI